MAEIGWIGLGRMGAPMARRLIADGHRLRLWDIDAARTGTLASAGAVPVGSAAEVARSLDAVVLCLPDGAAVEAAVLGPNGVLAAAAAGLLILDHSSIDPNVTRKLAAAAQASGAGWVDAPVSGGPGGAADCSLSVWLGGASEDVARARTIVASYAGQVFHAGPVGSGQVLKTCNQFVVCGTIAVWADLLRYVQALGLDRDAVVEALEGSGAESRVRATFAPAIAAGSLPAASLANLSKDLCIVADTASAAGVDLRLLGSIRERLESLRPDEDAQESMRLL